MASPKMKYPYKSNVRWAFMRWADIEDTENPGHVYLRRLRVIQIPLCAVYLHLIYTRDGDRAPHNHPMNFWSLILKGGYVEDRYVSGHDHVMGVGVRRRRRWTIARTVMGDFHRIIRLESSPTITLLFIGKRAQSWGFLTDDGYVDKAVYFEMMGM